LVFLLCTSQNWALLVDSPKNTFLRNTNSIISCLFMDADLSPSPSKLERG
jgi:hypothetical protein